MNLKGAEKGLSILGTTHSAPLSCAGEQTVAGHGHDVSFCVLLCAWGGIRRVTVGSRRYIAFWRGEPRLWD